MSDSSINNRGDWLNPQKIIPQLHTWVWVKFRSGMISQCWWDDMIPNGVIAWMPLEWRYW